MLTRFRTLHFLRKALRAGEQGCSALQRGEEGAGQCEEPRACGGKWLGRMLSRWRRGYERTGFIRDVLASHLISWRLPSLSPSPATFFFWQKTVKDPVTSGRRARVERYGSAGSERKWQLTMAA